MHQTPGHFQDHFSAQAGAYARFRPAYPEALFAWLASLLETRDLAWDCGSGNGQAALGLAAHFTRVIACDPSREQIAQALAHPRVTYYVASAEEPPAAAAGANLVTVAQALHWFDFDRFYPALRRTLKPDGLFAAWGYGRTRISPDVDAVVQHYYADIVGPYWPPDRRHIESGYQTIPFPLAEFGAGVRAHGRVDAGRFLRIPRYLVGDPPLPQGAWRPSAPVDTPRPGGSLGRRAQPAGALATVHARGVSAPRLGGDQHIYMYRGAAPHLVTFSNISANLNECDFPPKVAGNWTA
jgi:SAM-dependent methyltransferase